MKKSKGTHWVSSLINRHTAAYFDSFGIEYTPQEVLSKIKDKSITHNIFRIQDNDFYCITCIEYILAGKKLLYHTNFFSLNDFKKNDKRVYKYFKDK